MPDSKSSSLTFEGPTLILAIIVLATANFMAILDINIVNVAIPYIAGGLAVSADEATWVITSYAVAEAIIVPLTGWLAMRFGAVRIFVFAVIGFGIVSILGGLSISMPMLVVLRIAQGIMGAPLMPISQTLLLRISPPDKQQMALGMWSMTTIAAPVAGPWLGGIISDSIGWRWVFYINVPVAALCAVLAWQLLRNRETETAKNPIDYVGLALLVVWVGALQIMLDNGQKMDWFDSNFILSMAIVAVVAFMAFIAWEITERHPIVDLKIFRYRTFTVAVIVMFLTFGSFAGVLLIIPLWLQTNMGYTATAAGEIVALTAALGVLVAPITAALMSKVDPRALISAGILIVAGAAFYRTGFDQQVTFWQLAPAQMAFGVGLPLFFVPIMGLSVAAVTPEETASAAGLSNFIRTVSTAVSVAIVTTFWLDDASRSKADLVASLHSPQSLLSVFERTGASAAQALQAFDSLVASQGVMLSTNHLFFAIGVILLAAAGGVWLMPKPHGPLAIPTDIH